MCVGGDSKDAGREKFKKLFKLPSRGREYFIFYEQSEIKNLVTRDRIPHPLDRGVAFYFSI